MMHRADKRTILGLDGLAVGYGQRPVLTGVSFELEAGRFLSLLGPNGAGKTTLLRTLAGLLPPLAGQVLVDGVDARAMDRAKLARIQAVVLTDRLSPGMLSAYEVAALGRHPHTGFFGRLGPADHRAVGQALEMVGAMDLAARRYEQLSDGEKQKIVLARALAQEPRLILLDEPTVHLDLKHRLEVMTILRGLCSRMGIAVVASLHEVDLAARVSDQTALIHGGGLAAFGPPERVLDEAAVAGLYDLRGARYDGRLGVIELGGAGSRGPVFVLPGGGAAAGALRLLHKRDYALMCGIAHQGDIDTHIAGALGAELVSAPAFAPAPATALEQCRAMIDRAAAVVDSGFNLGRDNAENAVLLAEAARAGKPVFSLRPPGADQAPGVIHCADETELAARLSEHFHGSGASRAAGGGTT